MASTPPWCRPFPSSPMSTLRTASAPGAPEVPQVSGADDALRVAALLASSLIPGAAERDRAGVLPREEVAALDASGLLGITVPADHGGADVSQEVLAEVIRRIAAADPSLAQIPQGHFLQVNLLRLMADEDVQARLFADVLAGGRFASPLAERGTAHAQDLRTRLVRRDGILLLRGRKYYCTGASSARWLGVSALTETGRLVMARVPRDAPGVAPGEDWSAMGQRATASGTTDFDDVPVEHALVCEYWRLFERPQLLGARAQLVHAAIEVGIAGGALRDGLDFVRTRARPFFEAVVAGRARTAAEDPQTTRRAGRLAGRVRAAEELLRWAAGVLDDIGPWPADVERGGPGTGGRRPGEGLWQRGCRRGGERAVRHGRRKRHGPPLGPRPALAQRPHPQRPRSGRTGSTITSGRTCCRAPRRPTTGRSSPRHGPR